MATSVAESPVVKTKVQKKEVPDKHTAQWTSGDDAANPTARSASPLIEALETLVSAAKRTELSNWPVVVGIARVRIAAKADTKRRKGSYQDLVFESLKNAGIHSYSKANITLMAAAGDVVILRGLAEEDDFPLLPSWTKVRHLHKLLDEDVRSEVPQEIEELFERVFNREDGLTVDEVGKEVDKLVRKASGDSDESKVATKALNFKTLQKFAEDRGALALAVTPDTVTKIMEDKGDENKFYIVVKRRQ